MRKPRGILVAGNWKMNLGPSASRDFFGELGSAWTEHLSSETMGSIQRARLKIWVFAPYLSLPHTHEARGNLPISIGAQNAHWEKSGAFTGEISAPMLGEIGVHKVLVGHSERRQLFGETDETARKRADGLTEQGMEVIFCIGETRSERESAKTEQVLARQLDAAFPMAGEGSARFFGGKLVLAYEPVWAIGTGLTATPAQAEEAHAFIRRHLAERLGADAAGKVVILYGGSVTPENIATLLEGDNVDGVLVGGASMKPKSLLALIEAGGRAAAV